MSAIKSLFQQQMGMLTWRRHNNLFTRLVCYADEDFSDICTHSNMSRTPVFACKFSQMKGYQEYLALANEEGHIGLYDTEIQGTCAAVYAHNNAIFDLAWVPQSFKIISASGDHTAKLFSITESSFVLETIFQGHTRSLKCIACRDNDSSVFATGSRDGVIMIWDSRSKQNEIALPDIRLANTHFRKSQLVCRRNKQGQVPPTISGTNSITGLVFSDEFTLISCGAGDGFIKAWDIRKTFYPLRRTPSPKHCFSYSGMSHRNGFSNLTIDNSGRLYVNCLDSVIYCYNTKSYDPEPIMTYHFFKNNTFYVKSCTSPDGNYLFSGSSDDSAYIWDISQSKPLVRLDGHRAEVSSVAWRSDGNTVLVTCSDDVKHKIWRIGPDISSEAWDTYMYRGTAQKIEMAEFGTHICFNRSNLSNEDKPHSSVKRKADQDGTTNSQFQSDGEGSSEHDKEHRKLLKEITNDDEYSEKTSARKRSLFKCTDQSFSKSSSDENTEQVTAKRLRSDEDESNPLLEGLPNFMLDGTAPHLNTSPLKRPDMDWLTKWRNKRKQVDEDDKQSSPQSTPSKKRKCQKCSSDASTSPLLKFFRVTSNSKGQRSLKSSSTGSQSTSKLESSN